MFHSSNRIQQEIMQNRKSFYSEDMEWNSIIFDDETVSKNQQLLPRVIGGGRRLHAAYNYECGWCNKKTVPERHRRFNEYKSYEAHFRKFHLRKPGIHISLKQFRETTPRNEPKWTCPKCGNLYSYGNKSYHKSACHFENTESSEDDVTPSSSEEDVTPSSSEEEEEPSYEEEEEEEGQQQQQQQQQQQEKEVEPMDDGEQVQGEHTNVMAMFVRTDMNCREVHQQDLDETKLVNYSSSSDDDSFM